MRGLKSRIYFLIIYLIAVNNSIAANVNYILGSSLVHYENFNLLPEGNDSEFSQALNASASIIEDSANIRADLYGVVETIHYSNNKSSDITRARLAANGLWTIMPNQFEWFISDTFAQTAINPFLANTPSNQQNTNAFSTGPNYIVRINSNNNVKLEARLINNLSEGNIDNNRVTGATRWVYTVNNSLNMSINHQIETVKYKNTLSAADYSRNDLFFSVEYRKGLNEIRAEIGSTSIDNDVTNITDTERYRLIISNQRTKTSRISFLYTRNLSDTGTELLQSTNNIIDPAATLATTSVDTFIKEEFGVSYDKRTTYGELRINMNSIEDRYSTQQILDRTSKSINLHNLWNFHGNMSVTLTASYSNTLYDDVSANRDDDDYKYSLNYAYRARRNLELNLTSTSLKRESSVLGQDYEDLRFEIGLSYLFH